MQHPKNGIIKYILLNTNYFYGCCKKVRKTGEMFKQNGIFDKKTATSFRKNILEKGNTEDPAVLYKAFRGQEPSIEPVLKNRGLM